MTTKLKRSGKKNRWHNELNWRLAETFRERTQGLLSQSEYEAKLQEIESSLPTEGFLAEYELPNGVTRFVLRGASSGQVVGEFEFTNGLTA
jgi:hypothetical protein